MINLLKKNLVNIVKRIIINFVTVKKGDGDKSALLCYIVHPYLPIKHHHPNEKELFALVESLKNLNYRIKIVDYRRERITGKYDLCLGMGVAFEKAITNCVANKYISYFTGAPYCFQSEETSKALTRSYSLIPVLKNMDLNDLIRLPENYWPKQLFNTDGILQIGNQFHIDELKKYTNTSVSLIPSTYNSTSDPYCYIEGRDYNVSRNKFIWLGGRGLVHKGLDLCLSLFTNNPNIELHIFCEESRSYLVLKKKYRNHKNIIFHGFVDTNDSYFRNIALKSAFTILPSCSEGISTSVINCIGNFGMIPIVSLHSGFDFDTPGFLVCEQLSCQSLEEKINATQEWSVKEFVVEASKAAEYVSNNYNYKIMQSKIEDAITRIAR